MRHVILLLLLYSSVPLVLNNNIEFGHFDLLIREFITCPGPKRKDCVNSIIKSVDEHILDVVIDVKESMKITKGKISVSTGGKETMRLQLKNPCEHIFLKPLIKSLLNVTNECLIKKGSFHYSANIEEIAQKYYGGEFLFGTWTFKAVFFNDHCNFSCSLVTVDFVPRKNKTK